MSGVTDLLTQPELIRASAGAGKTFQLTGRVIGLLAAGEVPQQILATTFTRKAAGEIRDRVLDRLADAALSETARDLLRKHGVADLSATEAVELLRRLINDMHLLQFCTLDSFFVSIVRCFALDLGQSATWRLIDATEDAQMRTEAIAAALQDGDRDRTYELIRLLSGAPAARSVQEQVVQAVKNFYGLFRETNQAAWHWLTVGRPLKQEKLASLLAAVPGDALPTNKDGSPAKRWHTAWDKVQQFVADENWEALVGEGLVRKVVEGEPLYDSKKIPPVMSQVIEQLAEQARRVLLGRLAARTSATYELLERFDRHYTVLKRQAGALTFTDVTQLLAEGALAGRLNEIYYRLDSRTSHLLLDEFQDTSLFQWKVLEPIADEVLAAAGEIRKFFCVGDVKQAIYGWRGGVAEIFATLRARWPQLEDRPITETYRCRPQIVETVNQVFGNLTASEVLSEYPLVVSAWHEQFESHIAANEDQRGFVQLVAADADPQLRPKEMAAFAVTAAAAQVAAIHCEQPTAEIGVLVRTNAAVAEVIYRLGQLDPPIHASEEGGNPLTDSPAVGTVLALLRMADHPADQVARYRVLHSPLAQLVGLKDREDAEATRVARDSLRQLAIDGYGPTIWNWVTQLAPFCDERDTNRLAQLADLAARFEARLGARPIDFVRHVEVTRVEDASGSPVRVMTIHQSKGLQFDAVILPELDESLIRVKTNEPLADRANPTLPPHRVSCSVSDKIRALSPDLVDMQEQTEHRALRESLSVLYVAMTRARFALYLIINPQTVREKKTPKTFAGLLRTLLPEDPKALSGEVLFEAGDAAWLDKLPAGEPGVPLKRCTKPQLAKADSDVFRSLAEQSPSELVEGIRVPLGEKLQLNFGGATLRGTVFHAWYEQIEWLDQQGPPAESRLRDEAAKLRAPQDEVDDWLKTFYASLGQAEIRAQLSSASFAEGACVVNERRFAVRQGDTLLRGAIDRLIVEPERAVVIDYKTDDVDAAGGERELAEHYRPQLEAYCRAVADFQHLDRAQIEARLVLIETGRCVSLSARNAS